MGIAALSFCYFEGMHCIQVVTQHNATPPLLGDCNKSSVNNLNVQECDARNDHKRFAAGLKKLNNF